MSNSFRVKNNILHINVNGNITYKEQKSILNKLLDNITKIKDMVVIMDYKDALLNFEIREADRICRFITMKNEFRRNIQQLIFIPGKSQINVDMILMKLMIHNCPIRICRNMEVTF